MHMLTKFAAIVIAISTPAFAQSHTADPNGAEALSERISVEVEGDGPDVILVHGLASSTAVWADLADSLRQNHRIHLVQIAGFAGHPAPDEPGELVVAPAAEALAGYIRSNAIEDPGVIGHSLGGELGLMLASRHPDLIGRLMVVDAMPFYSLVINPEATEDNMEAQASAFRDATLSASKAQMEARQAATIARLVKTEEERPAIVEASLSSDRETVANAVYELMTTDLRPELDRITVPLKVVYAYDTVYGFPPEQIDATFRQAYSSSSTASFERIDGSYHFIMLDRREAFEQSVSSFLDH